MSRRERSRRQQVRVKRCGKSAPACGATCTARQTPSGARSSRGHESPARRCTSNGNPRVDRTDGWLPVTQVITESRLQVDSSSLRHLAASSKPEPPATPRKPQWPQVGFDGVAQPRTCSCRAARRDRHHPPGSRPSADCANRAGRAARDDRKATSRTKEDKKECGKTRCLTRCTPAMPRPAPPAAGGREPDQEGARADRPQGGQGPRRLTHRPPPGQIGIDSRAACRECQHDRVRFLPGRDGKAALSSLSAV